MRFGVALPHYSRLATRVALERTTRAAEALGFDSVWTTDHVLVGMDQREPFGNILEAMVTLAYVAALTKNVRLGTSVIVLAQREPVLVAKQVAALDVLSNGRLVLGIGVGWNEREFGFLGADFHNRGRRLDEYIRVLRILWSAPEPRLDGEYVHFEDAVFEPRPLQRGGPPIWIGGSSQATLRRAATLCDGWHADGATVGDFQAGMRYIRELAGQRAIIGSVRLRAAVGRVIPPRNSQGNVVANLSGSREEIINSIQAYAAAGASELVLEFGALDLEDNERDMRLFAEHVLNRF